jgi:hypothetical protein
LEHCNSLSQPRYALAATSVGNLVLFGGGYSLNGPFNVVDVFDVTNNTWTTATLSQARYYLAATTVDNRYALFGGGWNGSGPSKVVDIFDSLNGIWNTTTLSQARYHLASTSLGNLAFFLEVDKQMEINHPMLLISSTQHHKHGATQH